MKDKNGYCSEHDTRLCGCGSAEKSEARLMDLLNAWKAQEKEFSETLQIGRYGDDDGSYRHGRYTMLEDCIIDLEEALAFNGQAQPPTEN